MSAMTTTLITGGGGGNRLAPWPAVAAITKRLLHPAAVKSEVA
jgi:hypothetical protein